MNTETKKIKVNIDDLTVDASCHNDLNHPTIQSLEDWLLEVKSKGATNLEWHASAYDGEIDECIITAFYLRDETPEEKTIREKKEKEQNEALKKWEEQRDYSIYISLKKRFENKQ